MKFPSLPAASTLDGTEVSPLTQGGVDKRTTAQAIANLFKGTKGADIASAATTSIGAATGMFVHVTGTTTITSFGTGTAGWLRFVRFAGVLTLTHNATSLILPTGENITTAAGDCAIFVSEGSSNWRCLGYFRANGMPLTADTDTTLAANSDTKVPTQKAVKAYIDGIGALTTADIGVTVATLEGGKVPAEQLPALAITNVSVVNSEAAQLALVAQEGDVCIRSDQAQSYIHNGGTSGTMADWSLLGSPDAAAMLAAHIEAADPHSQYVLHALVGAANGVAGLTADARLAPALKDRKLTTLSIVAGEVAWDLAAGDDFVLTLTANATLQAPTNLPLPGYTREGHIVIKQDGTGGRTLTAPSGTRWPNKLAAVVTTTANAEDRWGYSVYNNGGTAEITFWPARDIGTP